MQTDELRPPFAGLRHGAGAHFQLLFYEAVFRLVHALRRLSLAEGRPPETCLPPFLACYFAELRPWLPEAMGWQESLAWWREQIRGWEERSPVRLPLRALEQHDGLAHEERVALVTLGMVEEDIRFSSLFATLQEPLAARRPCIGVLGMILGEGESTRAAPDPWSVAQRLLAAGLVLAENQDGPRAEWVLRIPTVLWDVIRGRPSQSLGPETRFCRRQEFPPLKELVLDAALRERLQRLPAVLARSEIDAVILRGAANSGRRTVMGALARALRRDLVCYDRRGLGGRAEESPAPLGPLCALTGALPAILIDPGPGEKIELPSLPGYRGPIGVIMRREGGVGGPAVERSMVLTLPSPAPQHRLTVWQRALGEGAGPEIEQIADRYLLPLGNVQRAAGIAAAYARLERRSAVAPGDVLLACRSLDRQVLDTLAQRLEVSGTWDRLVVSEATAAELTDLERRCRHRERLSAHLGAGFQNSVNSGVRALFHGPSGTGKTLAARILASVLQMDIYRVDLAAIVNKYVGETEKNLGQLLARAEELDVILLIDEGDALMTARTDVKSANDRYANLETNYLLQRLESYGGILLVTTNAGNRIDLAFQRRFDLTVAFYPPDARERLLIWHEHLSGVHRVSPDCLERIAGQCALTGGQIRNAALYATLLALDAGRGGQVSDTDLEAAVRREYRSAGASCPLAGPGAAGGHHLAVAQFLAEVGR